jgi:hypothetical protein
MITIAVEPERKRIRSFMEGMLTVAEVAEFSRDEQAAARRMGWSTGQFDLLIETGGNLVQTQDVMHAFSELMTTSPLKARKIATVRAGALTRMQSRRLIPQRRGFQVFEAVADAEAWLDED